MSPGGIRTFKRCCAPGVSNLLSFLRNTLPEAWHACHVFESLLGPCDPEVVRNHRNRCISKAGLSFPWLYSAKTPRGKKAASPAAVVALPAAGWSWRELLANFWQCLPLWLCFVRVVPYFPAKFQQSSELFCFRWVSRGVLGRLVVNSLPIFEKLSALSWPNYQKSEPYAN